MVSIVFGETIVWRGVSTAGVKGDGCFFFYNCRNSLWFRSVYCTVDWRFGRTCALELILPCKFVHALWSFMSNQYTMWVLMPVFQVLDVCFRSVDIIVAWTWMGEVVVLTCPSIGCICLSAAWFSEFLVRRRTTRVCGVCLKCEQHAASSAGFSLIFDCSVCL